VLAQTSTSVSPSRNTAFDERAAMPVSPRRKEGIPS